MPPNPYTDYLNPSVRVPADYGNKPRRSTSPIRGWMRPCWDPDEPDVYNAQTKQQWTTQPRWTIFVEDDRDNATHEGDFGILVDLGRGAGVKEFFVYSIDQRTFMQFAATDEVAAVA